MVPNTSPTRETCRVQGCNRSLAHKGKNLCKTHAEYDRLGKELHPIVKPNPLCSMEGCAKQRSARGWCRMHYTRFIRHGDPNAILEIRGNDNERFWSKVEKTETCWKWTGAPTSEGYGTMWIAGKFLFAHRLSYEKSYGPIAEGMHIDHICHNRTCVNPDHLRAVSQKQNMENHQGATVRSSTGRRGVYWLPNISRYRAVVQHNKRTVHVGYFSTAEDAEAAVIEKRNELFTHNDLDRI